jgi:hypothetical protein
MMSRAFRLRVAADVGNGNVAPQQSAEVRFQLLSIAAIPGDAVGLGQDETVGQILVRCQICPYPHLRPVVVRCLEIPRHSLECSLHPPALERGVFSTDPKYPPDGSHVGSIDGRQQHQSFGQGDRQQMMQSGCSGAVLSRLHGIQLRQPKPQLGQVRVIRHSLLGCLYAPPGRKRGGWSIVHGTDGFLASVVSGARIPNSFSG